MWDAKKYLKSSGEKLNWNHTRNVSTNILKCMPVGFSLMVIIDCGHVSHAHMFSTEGERVYHHGYKRISSPRFLMVSSCIV